MASYMNFDVAYSQASLDIITAKKSDITAYANALGVSDLAVARVARNKNAECRVHKPRYLPVGSARVARNKNAECRVHKTRPLHTLFCFARRQKASASCTMI